MIIKCTCSDLVNNGDHYCPIHGTFATPTPPEGEAVPEQVEEFMTCPKCKHTRGFKAEFVWPNAIRCKCAECGEWSTREEWGLEPLPAPVVSTAASEPYIVVREGHKRECASNLRIAVTQNMNVGVGPAPWQNGKPVYVPIPACNCGAEPAVAPESYKPAEANGVEIKAREIAIELCAELVNSDPLLYCPATVKKIEKQIVELCAAMPVTVEAPLKKPCPVCHSPHPCQHSEPEMHRLVSVVLEQRAATPKPIGDVEAVARKIANATVGAILHAANKEKKITLNYLDEMTIEIAAILSPFFAPAIVRCHCCGGTQLWQRNKDGEIEVFHDCASGLHAMKERAEKAEAECATLRKERDDSEKAIAKALRFTPSEEEPEECAPWMVEAEPEPMGPFSLIEAITAMMEMFDREFSKADKRGEAAEAQLSTHLQAFKDARDSLNDALSHLRHSSNENAIIYVKEGLKFISAALAPTPEVAPKDELP